jgi:hypothetical protein
VPTHFPLVYCIESGELHGFSPKSMTNREFEPDNKRGRLNADGRPIADGGGDDAGFRFIKAFYEALRRGQSLSEATVSEREMARKEDRWTWMAFVV